MAERWVTLKLGGYLGREFGRTHKFLVSSTKEAVHALSCQNKKFKEAMKVAHTKGVTFAVFNGKHNIGSPEELSMGTKEVVRILPVYEGSKRAGAFQTILGVALIAVATFATGGFAGGLAAAGLWGTVAVAGGSMLLGGISQLLTPQPKGLKTTEDSANQASYAFGGPVNTTAQGNPIGLLYGEREVGGAFISAGILAEDQA